MRSGEHVSETPDGIPVLTVTDPVGIEEIGELKQRIAAFRRDHPACVLDVTGVPTADFSLVQLLSVLAREAEQRPDVLRLRIGDQVQQAADAAGFAHRLAAYAVPQ